MMNLFCQEFRYSFDEKNRIFIPSKYREILGPSFVISARMEPSLAIFTHDEWKEYTDKIEQLPASVVMKVKQFIFPKTFIATPDSHGRVVIPQDLKAYAGIDKNAVIIGVGNHAQIWAEEEWDRHFTPEDTKSLAEIAGQFGL